MKLRNKKTGKIVELDHFSMHYNRPEEWGQQPCSTWDHSLAELNEEWEDYTPTEPLIKDEKIRKAVRAWAEACGLSYATYKQASNEFYDPNTRGAFAIKFKLIPVEVYLEDGECYTIAELCGEEGYKPDARERLEAWRRLKDKGFRFDGVEVFSKGLIEIDAVLPALEDAEYAERTKMIDDLWLLFPEEEEE